MGNQAQDISIDAPHSDVERFAKAGGTASDRVEYPGNVGRGPANYAENVAGTGLLLARFGQLAPGLGEFFGQLLDSAFRRGMIVGGRSCHDHTRFPCLPARLQAPHATRLADEAVGNATRYGASMERPNPGEFRAAASLPRPPARK